MSGLRHFDLLIIGGGCAGLSLAMRLAREGYAGSVAIVEPRRTYLDDRTWCFWSQEQSAYGKRTGFSPMDLVSTSWSRWRFSRHNRSIHERSSRAWAYRHIRSLDFYRRALASIRSHPDMELLLGDHVQRITDQRGRLSVETEQQKFTASEIVDTRPPSDIDLSAVPLFQCFVGHEIELKPACRDLFDVNAAEIMTDMRSDADGLVFSYILPFSPHRALVEITRFSPSPVPSNQLSAELQQLLKQRGWLAGQTLRTEKGALPMGLPHPESAPSANIVRAGAGGGALRAATGYGFCRIQQWADACSSSLISGGPALPQKPDSHRQQFMDQLFLRVIRERPGLAPKLFERMASRIAPSAFIRFMSDCADWKDCLRVVKSLPPGPFLKTATRLAQPDEISLTSSRSRPHA